MSESELSLEIVTVNVDDTHAVLEYIAAECRRMWHALMKALKPFFDWLKSPQTRRWMRDAITVMRRAGIIQPRRKQISTKRAMIYQRKMGIA